MRRGARRPAVPPPSRNAPPGQGTRTAALLLGQSDFFAIVGTWTLHEFTVLDVIGDGRQVVAEVRAEFSLPNGGRFVDEELHLWTFDESGRVVRFRHYRDTAKHIATSRGEDTTSR